METEAVPHHDAAAEANDSRSVTPTPSATGTASAISDWESGSMSASGLVDRDDTRAAPQAQPLSLEDLVISTQQDLQGLLRKLHNTVENLPVCQAQAYFVTARCASLVEALMLDGLLMDLATFKAAAENVRTLVERVDAKMVQFSIYGSAKATVLIREMTGYLEGFNMQIDECLVLFAITKHDSLVGWEKEWDSAQHSDIEVAVETIVEILRDDVKVEAIKLLGPEALHTFNEFLDMAESQGYLEKAERMRRMA